MVFLLKDFVYAEKNGNWDLHLETLGKMIPFFHSTGLFHMQNLRKYISRIVRIYQKKWTRMNITSSQKWDTGLRGEFKNSFPEFSQTKL